MYIRGGCVGRVQFSGSGYKEEMTVDVSSKGPWAMIGVWMAGRADEQVFEENRGSGKVVVRVRRGRCHS